MFLRLSLYTSQYKIMISVSQNKIVMAFNNISILNIMLGVVLLISCFEKGAYLCWIKGKPLIIIILFIIDYCFTVILFSERAAALKMGASLCGIKGNL